MSVEVDTRPTPSPRTIPLPKSPEMDDDLPTPAPPFATMSNVEGRTSRPLSEISNNSERRRSTTASIKGSDKDKDTTAAAGPTKSRPASEIREGKDVQVSSSTSIKRLSSGTGLQTLTVNLVEYAKQQRTKPAVTSSSSTSAPPTIPTTPVPAPTTSPATSALPTVVPPPQEDVDDGDQSKRASSVGPPPPSPTTKPSKPSKPVHLASPPASPKVYRVEKDGSPQTGSSHLSPPPTTDIMPDPLSEPGVSNLYVDQRSKLRQSPSRPVVTSKFVETPQSEGFRIPIIQHTRPTPAKPKTTEKPKWLRRRSTNVEAKSKSPSPRPSQEDVSLAAASTSSAMPPPLPPRKGKTPSLKSKQSLEVLSAEPSFSRSPRSGFVEMDSSTFHSPGPMGPPPTPMRDGFRNRLAAWKRSESSSSIASDASTSTMQLRQQAARQVLSQAGSAVSKGWAGIRARGVRDSIGGMNALGSLPKRSNMVSSPSWASNLSRRGARSPSEVEPHGSHVGQLYDGPFFDEGVVRRPGGPTSGRVFGKDLISAGKLWGIEDAEVEVDGETEWDRRRKACLPAVVIRTLEHLDIWLKKEEGMFRVSGRNSHVTRLRKEFDSGADLDLKLCNPGDVDPHAVAGLFKAYLRDLPYLIPPDLAVRFERQVHRVQDKALPSVSEQLESGSDESKGQQIEDLPTLLNQLPSAHWFLLADIVKIFDLVPKQTVNRMDAHGLKLALGPSLKLPGNLLNELVADRERLFHTPPPSTRSETDPVVIDFGHTDISPPSLPSRSEQNLASSPFPASREFPDSSPSPTISQASSRRIPRLNSKSSLSRMFTSQSSSPKKKSSSESMSILEIPPRVDVPLSGEVGLFPSVPRPQDPETAETRIVPEKPNDKVEHLIDPPKELNPVSEERSSPSLPTPIADKFSASNITLQPLREPRPVSGSRSAQSSPQPDNAAEPNPARVFRRGPPVFFQSSGSGDRHSRSKSTGSVQSLGPGGPVGVKRKDDSPPLGIDEPGQMGETRVKRLSAGPGVINVKELVKSMEVTQ